MAKILPIFLPFASCSSKCIFCDQNAISGVSSSADLDNLFDTQFNKWQNISTSWDQIAFYGGSFTAIEKDIRISLYEKAMKLGLKIRFSTRPDIITPDVLDEIQKYKIYFVELGIQSLNDDVLKASKRTYNHYIALKAVKEVSSVTNCGVQLMTGMYQQNITSSILDAEILSEMNVKSARIYPSLVFKNTELYNLYKENRYIPASMEETIFTAGAMLIYFESMDINVIRIGLPKDAEISGGMIAGPFHDSMGDIIKTYIMMLYMNMGKETAYSGYKKIGREFFPNNFINYQTTEKIDIQKICKELKGYYFENSKRYFKGEAASFAKRLACASYNR